MASQKFQGLTGNTKKYVFKQKDTLYFKQEDTHTEAI